MKKFLFLFILIFYIGSANATSLQITRVAASVLKSYSGARKDTVLKNNAKVTANLLPLTNLTFYFKWTGLIVPPDKPQEVNFEVYSFDDKKLYSLRYSLLTSNTINDSAYIYLPINLPDNPIGTYLGYQIRVTYQENQTTRNILAISNNWSCSIVADPNKIYNNVICCSEVVTLPYTPTKPLAKDPSVGSTQTTTNLPIKYIWEKGATSSAFSTIPGATNASYFPPRVTKDTYYRRVALAYSGNTEVSYSFSNTVSLARQTCTLPITEDNLICGDQVFYNLKHGDTIYPSKILGTDPKAFDIDRRKELDFFVMDDGINWYTKHASEYYRTPSDKQTGYEIGKIIFDINKGGVQYIYIKREYSEWYDEYNCGPWGTRFPCGQSFHLKSTSNVVTLILSSFGTPKPVPTAITNESMDDFVSCNPGAQVKTFSVPRINNGETYKWEIPAAWTANTVLQGPYANSITINTNAAGANYAVGGNVCLTITQPGQVNTLCTYIHGSDPFRVSLPATINGCEGQTVTVNPAVLVNNVPQNPYDYTFNWEAYQTPEYTCSNIPDKYDPDCKGLKINISNVYQNKNQPIKVTVLSANQCTATASTVLTTSPGLQMGILYSYADPKALSTTTLAPDTTNNYLYFTDANNNIECAYFDNTESIWKYYLLKNKLNGANIGSTGALYFYKGSTNKLFYIKNGSLYYAESLDNGISWTDYFINGSIANDVDNRFKIWAGNIYYMSNKDRNVYYKPISNTNAQPVRVGNAAVNYSQDMFTVEDGVIAYADINNVIVAFDALTGTLLPINVAGNLTTVAYNSAISVYNKNIYYISTGNTLRILQKSNVSAAYVSSQDASNQLAGPFTINKQTGTVYAKAYDVAGKQIYFLNNQWNSVPIKNYLDAAPVQSAMVYANNHAYYIASSGLVANTFYVAPCIPAVLRTANNLNEISGDVVNERLPLEIEQSSQLVLYPNPARDLMYANIVLENVGNVQIKLISVTGDLEELLINKQFEEGTHEIDLPLSKYAAGIYIVQLYTDGHLIASSKAIKY